MNEDRCADLHRSPAIGAFVRRTRRAVNRRTLLWSLAAAAAGVWAVACLAAAGFALSGVGVPAWLYALAGGVMAGLALTLWGLRRRTDPGVARLIDERFGLEDGVHTAFAFERDRRDDAFETLQLEWTRRRLDSVDPGALVPVPGRRLLAGAVAAPLLAGLLALAPESAAVIEARAERARTVALASELNQGIERLVEEEIGEADDREARALDPDSLRGMVDKLEVSPEKAELLRQYAEMERGLADKASRLESPSLERLLDEAAAQLASDPETAGLGEALSQKRLRDAADELDGFKLSEDVSPETLERKRAELDRLKTLAKRLAEAARKHDAATRGSRGDASANAGASAGSSTASSKAPSRRDAAGSTSPGADGRPGRPGEETGATDQAAALADELHELEEAVEQAEKSLGQCRSGRCTPSEIDELARCSSRANSSLDRLGERLRASASRRGAQQRRRSMRRTLARCQSTVAGQCASPFARGRNAGSGASDSQREGVEREDGRLARVDAAARASGPALTTVEEAGSGDGAAGRGAARTTREYTRRLESFIERPDVPESVKDGVKLYLENIHRTPDEEGSQP